MRLLLFFLLFSYSIATNAQFTYVVDQSIPVKDSNGNDLSFAWAGGLNAAQYNTMDINGDNLPDLVLFDKMANEVITFINENSTYRYLPEYAGLFPEVTNWLLLRDFNCDGKKDIFTGDQLGIKVYENITQPGELLQWKPTSFFSQDGKSKSPVIITKGFSGKINLQLQFDDLPSISDVDGDGDLDILNFQFGGFGTIEFHKNFGMERYGRCDSLEFERLTNEWGGITECECGEFAFNNEVCPPSTGGRTKHAGGKFLLAIDMDHDLDQDLLYSESSCTHLYFLRNDGTVQNPIFTSIESFPAPNPVNFTIFPSAFYEDLDFDGVSDLIATPNIYTKEFNNTDLQHSNWFYKNTASNLLPSFNFIKIDLLQDQMIDVGNNSVPAFADEDGDNDLDMFIGQDNAENLSGSITYYENTGTRQQPAFKFITNDYLNLTQALGYSVYNIKPQFADINGDNRIDLVFSATNLQTNKTQLYFIENQNATGLNFSAQVANQVANLGIDFSENACASDINNDGLTDLLIGKNTGAVQYWKNNGPKGSLNLALEDNSFLNMGPSLLRQSAAIASADLNSDGKADLVIGDQSGILSILSNYKGATDASNGLSEILFNPLKNAYEARPLGGRIWPTAANLFNTNKPAILVGNTLGGLHVLRNDEGQSLSDKIHASIYPNPVIRDETLTIITDREAQVHVINMMGQELGEPFSVQANQLHTFQVSPLATGIYLLRFVYNGDSTTLRIMVR